MRFGIALAAVLAVLALLGSAAVSAQTADQRIAAALARARSAGIPVSLLEAKIAEGKAKGVSMERISAAIEKREAALERASAAMRGSRDVTDADLSVGADAVEAGISEVVLQAIAESAPRDRRVVAIAALTELVRLGHVPEAALERVKEALKRGPDALANLPGEAGKSGRRVGPPDNAGASGGRGGAVGPPPSVPAPGRGTQPSKPTPPTGRGRGGV